MDRSTIEKEIEDLRRQFQQDSAGALDAFARLYGDPIRRVVRRMLRSDTATRHGEPKNDLPAAQRRHPAGINRDSAASIIARDIAAALLTTTPERGLNTPAGETICGREFPTIG